MTYIDINQLDPPRSSPLHAAILASGTASVNMLADHIVECGRNLDALDYDGYSPLHSAVVMGRVDLVRLLFQLGADLSSVQRHGWTPLHSAVHHGHLDVAKLLIELGANIGAQDASEMTALHIATFKGQMQFVELLADHTSDFTTLGIGPNSVINAAASQGHVEIANFLNGRMTDRILHSTPGQLPVVSRFIEEPARPVPEKLFATRYIDKDTTALDHDDNPMLYIVSNRDNGQVILHNLYSKRDEALCAGTTAMKGTVDSFFQMAAPSGIQQGGDKPFELQPLRPDLSNDLQAVVPGPKSPGSIAKDGEQSGEFEWVGSTKNQDWVTQEFVLYPCRSREQSQGGANSRRVRRRVMADITITDYGLSRVSSAERSPFSLHIFGQLDTRARLAIVITALLIWNRHQRGEASVKYFRERFGYNNRKGLGESE